MAGKRHTRGDGTVYLTKEGRWRGAVMITGEDGIPRRRQVSGATEKEAWANLDALKARAAKGQPHPRTLPTLAEHLDRWLAIVVTPALRPNTRVSYGVHVRRISAEMGALRIDRVRAERIQEFYGVLLARKYSPQTIRGTHRLLHRAFKFARRWHGVASPMEDVDPPGITPIEHSILTALQARALLDTMKTDRLGPLWALFLTAGLRMSEARGLRWQDIDHERGEIHVRVQLQREGGDWVFSPPKSKKPRDISVPAAVLDLLHAHRAVQDAERVIAGEHWTHFPLVFVKPSGKPFHTWEVNVALRAAFARAGIPRVRPHDLRHTYSSLTQKGGASMKAVQQAMGHSSIVLTGDTYTHTDAAQRQAVADAIERVIWGESE